MADDPSVYGSYMNFFLPRSAQLGGRSLVPTPGLFDMLGNMGLSNWPGSGGGTPDEQKKRQQQQMSMGQYGLKMLQPQQTAPPPAPMQNTPYAPSALPPATQVTPSNPQQGGYPQPRMPAPMLPPRYPFSGNY